MAMVQSKITAAETQSKTMKIFGETFSRLFSASFDFAEILQQYGLTVNAIREELVRSPMPIERRVSFLPYGMGSNPAHVVPVPIRRSGLRMQCEYRDMVRTQSRDRRR